jgi:Periplasmic protease
LTTVGSYITPASAPVTAKETAEREAADSDPAPRYMEPLLKLWNCRLPDRAVLGFGAQAPIFVSALPPGFTQRLGKAVSDVFYSGTFESGGYKLGFIRIPSFAPNDQNAALSAFAKEIAFFNQNTDGLVIDVMRNPGGSVAYDNAILSMLFVNSWRSVPFEVRATSSWVEGISSSYEQAKAQGAPPNIVDLLQGLKTEFVAANHANRGRTHAIPLDDVTIDREPARDTRGIPTGYNKPFIVLVDELTASGGDAFAATIQDNSRGILVGWRTMGAGGNVFGWEAGSYSLGSMTVTGSLMVRKDTVHTKEYPAAPYVENIGVYPDLWADYMTRDNLTTGGKAYVDTFVKALVDYIHVVGR